MEPESTTLADALLDDLDDLSDVEAEEESADDKQGDEEGDNDNDSDDNGNMMVDAVASTVLSSDPSADVRTNSEVIKKVAHKKKRWLHHDTTLKNHIRAVREYEKQSKQRQSSSNNNNKEEQEKEHLLIVQSNKQLSNLSDELTRSHGELRTLYHPKFQELEELLPNPVQYKNAVRAIWNEMDLTRVNDELNEFLNSNQIITISVAGSTTSGRQLTETELDELDAVLSYMDEIIEMQTELTDFIESRMESLAPSVCALVGPSIAARLIGLAGGLAELSKIPACNLQVLGQVKQNAASRAGMSSIATRPHTGILIDCDLVKRCPKQLHKKALKVVAAKLALAIRCDFVNVDTGRQRSDKSGVKFREEIESKLNKWLEPDKAPVLKALPKPDLTVKKRRGGKRMRRLKERYEETAMMKQANTRAFSTQTGEYGDDAMGLTMGLLDTAESTGGSGSLRKTTEKRKMRYANTKASRKRAAQMSAAAAAHNNATMNGGGAGGTSTSGLASSMAFTPVQGMELVNPDANKERVREANRKWFSDNAGFQSALPRK